MEKERPIIDLTLELKDTDYTARELKEFEACLFYSIYSTLEEDEIFSETIDLLEKDRSKEAINLFIKIILI